MILNCPACQKKYLVPDNAIGAEGRQVRCAACRHSWFEPARNGIVAPETMVAPADPVPYLPVPPSPPEIPKEIERPSAVEQPPIPPSWTSPPPEPEVQPARAEDAEEQDYDYDPYAHEALFKPRRNRSRSWTIAAAIASLLLIAGIGAVYYFGNPNFLAKLGLPVGEIDTPLITQFTSDRGPKEGMPATAPYVTIHGQIINPTDQSQRVPDVIAELLDGHSRVVYSWTITPTRRTIAAKGTLPIDDTAVNIPMSARETRLTFSGVDPR